MPARAPPDGRVFEINNILFSENAERVTRCVTTIGDNIYRKVETMKTINEKLAKRKATLKRVYSKAKFRKHFPTVEYYVEQQKNSNSKK